MRGGALPGMSFFSYSASDSKRSTGVTAHDAPRPLREASRSDSSRILASGQTVGATTTLLVTHGHCLVRDCGWHAHCHGATSDLQEHQVATLSSIEASAVQ